MIDDAMRKYLTLFAAALAMLGCGKEERVATPAPEASAPSGIVPLVGTLAPAGDPVTVHAGFASGAETRSRLEVEESAAKILWTGGDSFRCLFNFQASGQYSIATFTTQDDGVTEAAFSTSRTLAGTGFHCFYPDYTKVGILPDGSCLYGINLPATQHAVAGGIEEGLNRAFAYADQLTRTLDDPLTFHNAISLLKFRMDGAVVSRVKEVTFSCYGSIAGDLSIVNQDGIPTESSRYSFNNETKSSKVVLTGDFEADTDYFIALWPRQTNGFAMEFSDGEANTTVKESSKSVTFERSRIKDFGTIHLGDDFVNNDGSSIETVQYMTATEGPKPVTIAVIPEGFTVDELPQFELLAKSGIDVLFDTEPYKTYRNRFNVYLLKVPSRESGASVTDGNGNVTTPVMTYFGAKWGVSSYGDMSADDTKVFDFVSGHCPDILDGTHPITEVPILMIINDQRYGGICRSYSNGQGFGMVPYTYGGDGIYWSMPNIVPATDDPLPEPVDNDVLQAYYRQTTNDDRAEVGGTVYGDWRNTLVHEFGGHCFGRLGDEYWSDYMLNYSNAPIDGHHWPVPMALNLSASPDDAPWKADLLDRLDQLTELDARYGRIGTFQGGGSYLYGRWRSEKISCMIDNRTYFSAWQRYLITKRIFTLSDDLDSFSFESWLANDVTVDPVRDVSIHAVPDVREHRTYRKAGPLPPPVLVEL